MTTAQLDTCHCIVRHPEKAKFLVVEHEENWSPPVLMFPPGSIDFRVAMINQGMLEKYGLVTRVIRPLMRAPNYHCIEMELASPQPTRNLKAVWVDQAEYLRTRSAPGDLPDPFAVWFEEQVSGKIPAKRAPFLKPGWFLKADHWVQFQLDRLGIQVTGSVEQFRQGWTSSCLLRVKTNQGQIYFKAGHEAAPGEAALTAALAQRWPQTVGQPLAVDEQRNWMLHPDFRSPEAAIDLQQLPVFAKSVAQLQIESAESLDRWKAMGCALMSLEDLAQTCQQPEQLKQVLQEGGGGLTDQQWSGWLVALQSLAGECRTLANIGLPLTLVHTDFRDVNLAVYQDRHLLLNWSGTVLSHPFLVLSRVFRSHQSSPANAGDASAAYIDDELYQKVTESYLQPFAALASQDDLMRGLDAAEKLNPLWILLRMLNQLEWIEARTPHYFNQVVSMQIMAKRMIE